MSIELLKEVLIPFSAKELEHFNEATSGCTDEQKIAVAKRMAEEQLPDGFRLTESAIRRLVAREQVNWYPGININSEGHPSTATGEGKINELKERQYNAYRASGMSESEASATSGFTPKNAA
jgi:hypothetical protein